MAASVDFKTYVDQACRAADEFVNIYYETMDKRRRALTRLYLDKATLVWNGNAVSGQEELNKFFEMLPSSEFQVNVLDCQPVHEGGIFRTSTLLPLRSTGCEFRQRCNTAHTRESNSSTGKDSASKLHRTDKR
uniref:NTF2-related export protein n=1 Tax=Junco hyemalis TaxID=40217 RepID=A0A8C5JBC0_JUNHY